MAKRVISHVVYEDDLTGQEVDETELSTIPFTIEGMRYEIDLAGENADKFRADLAPYINAAKKLGGKATKKKATTSASNGRKPDTSVHVRRKTGAKQIRDWARSNDVEVPERGRIPDAVREQFEAAQAG